jgi:hypothetical protein
VSLRGGLEYGRLGERGLEPDNKAPRTSKLSVPSEEDVGDLRRGPRWRARGRRMLGGQYCRKGFQPSADAFAG